MQITKLILYKFKIHMQCEIELPNILFEQSRARREGIATEVEYDDLIYCREGFCASALNQRTYSQ